jgi:hypothetical protein
VYPDRSLSLSVALRLLKRKLGGFENGEVWIQALKLNEIGRVLNDEEEATVSEEDHELISEVLSRFERLKSDRDCDAVTNLAGFASLDKAIEDLLAKQVVVENAP